MNAHLRVLGIALLLAGCSADGGAPRAVSSTPAVTSAPAASCTPPTSRPFAWPAPVPADLPQPPGATYQGRQTDNGITVVRFSTPTSLRQGVLFVLREVQRAGFTLGRGDAEPTEADAPFGRGDLHGIYKLHAVGGCATTWLVAVSSGTAPRSFLPTASPGPSSSPLPFG